MSLRTFRNILLVDCDPAAGGWLAKLLAGQRLMVPTLVQVDSFEVIKHFADSGVDVVLVDPSSQRTTQVGIVREIKRIAPGIPLVVLTDLDEEDAAANALRDGAQDYLIKGRTDGLGLVRSLNYAIERRALEEALFEEKERAEITLSCIGDAVACTDLKGNLTYLNPVAESLTRWGSNDAIGRPMCEVFRIVSAEDHTAIPDPMEIALRLDRVVHLPIDSILVRRDGIEVAVEDAASPIHDRSGRPIGAVMVLRDVSAARAAALHLANSAEAIASQYALVNRVNSELAAIVHSSPVAIYATDPEGLVTLWSPSAERMTGFTRAEVLGKFLPIVPDQETEKAKALIREICGGQKVSNIQLSRVRKDGTVLELSVSAGPLIDESGHARGAISMAEDITEAQIARKRVERMQSEFVSTVSHELRTPLTSIGGSLGLIAGGAVDALSGRGARLIRIAYENTQRLSRLVDDILDIERLQTGRVEFNFVRVLLEDLINQAITANAPVAEKNGVEHFRVGRPCDAFIRADPDRVIQALTNLISNAIKFSPTNGRVDISTEHSGSDVRVSIDDFGPGIAEDFRPRIFERFSQADSSSARQKGGSGLGLSIVRDIIDRHGGTVSFDTALGAGSTFHLQFPVFGTSNEASAGTGLIQTDNRVLVYALEEAKSAFICETLRSHGLDSIPALTESQALDAAARGATKAAIIALPFGGSDLGNFLRSLRGYPRAGHAPIMLLCVDATGTAHFNRTGADPIRAWMALVAKRGNAKPRRAQIHAVRGSAKGAILHVSDRPEMLSVLRRALSAEFRTVAVPTMEKALASLQRKRFDIVVLDAGLLVGLGKVMIAAVVAAAEQPVLAITFTGTGSRRNSGRTSPTAGATSVVDLSLLPSSPRPGLSKKRRKHS